MTTIRRHGNTAPTIIPSCRELAVLLAFALPAVVMTVAPPTATAAANCETIRGYSIQYDRDVAASLAVGMRDGLLLAELGIAAMTQQDVGCINERGAWQCVATAEICRLPAVGPAEKSAAVGSTAIPPPQLKSTPGAAPKRTSPRKPAPAPVSTPDNEAPNPVQPANP